MASRTITPKGFLYRWLAAVVLVAGTYNPWTPNMLSWGFSDAGPWSLRIFAGLLFLIGYVIYLRATFESIGWPGVLVVLCLFGSVGWILLDAAPWIATSSVFLGLFSIITLSSIMTIGLSWSFVRNFLTNQITGS